ANACTTASIKQHHNWVAAACLCVIEHGKTSDQFLDLLRVLKILDLKVFLHHFDLLIDISIAEFIRDHEGSIDKFLDRAIGKDCIVGGHASCHTFKIERETNASIFFTRLDFQHLPNVAIDGFIEAATCLNSIAIFAQHLTVSIEIERG